jgi:hypothetical protein
MSSMDLGFRGNVLPGGVIATGRHRKGEYISDTLRVGVGVRGSVLGYGVRPWPCYLDQMVQFTNDV